MRSLVIYESKYGNTELIARAVAEGLGERGEAQVVALGDVLREQLTTAHLVVLGAPTHIKGIPWSMRRFLRRSPREWWFGRPVAVFDTRFHEDRKKTGSAAISLEARLQRMGALSVARPESFFVIGMDGPLEEGELTRAKLWGRQLHLSDRVTVEGE